MKNLMEYQADVYMEAQDDTDSVASEFDGCDIQVDTYSLLIWQSITVVIVNSHSPQG